MILILFWILCGIAAAFVASSKGANGGLWLVVGFLLGPSGLAMSFAASGAVCPACRKGIHPSASKCPYCQTVFTEGLQRTASPPPPTKNEFRGTIIALAVFVAIFGGLFILTVIKREQPSKAPLPVNQPNADQRPALERDLDPKNFHAPHIENAVVGDVAVVSKAGPCGPTPEDLDEIAKWMGDRQKMARAHSALVASGDMVKLLEIRFEKRKVRIIKTADPETVEGKECWISTPLIR